MEITKEEIKQAVESNENWRYNENRINDWKIEVGFTTGRHVWYWFEIIEGDEKFDALVSFRNRYSQNTGKDSGGYVQGQKAMEMIKATNDPEFERLYS